MYTRQSLLRVYNLNDNIYRDKAISERFQEHKEGVFSHKKEPNNVCLA